LAFLYIFLPFSALLMMHVLEYLTITVLFYWIDQFLLSIFISTYVPFVFSKPLQCIVYMLLLRSSQYHFN